MRRLLHNVIAEVEITPFTVVGCEMVVNKPAQIFFTVAATVARARGVSIILFTIQKGQRTNTF